MGYFSTIKDVFRTSTTLIGLTVGAGILGIPFVVKKSGFLWSLPIFLFVALITLYLNLAAGEVSLRTKGYHQFPALVKKYLGPSWSRLMLIDIFLLGYGSLTAYLVGGGEILTSLLGGSAFYNTLIFGLILSIIILLDLRIFENIELLFVLFLFLIILFIGFFSYQKIVLNNFLYSNLSSLNDFFFPLSVILFAFFGTLSIPELKEEVSNLKHLKPAIITGVFLITFIYLLFTFFVLGISGSETTPVATIGVSKLLGRTGFFLFSFFGLFAIITSFIAIGFVLKDVFHLDLNFSKKQSWFFSIIIPFLIYFFGLRSFTLILNIVGSFHAILLSFIVFNLLRASRKKGERIPEYSLKEHPFFELIITLFLILGAYFLFF